MSKLTYHPFESVPDKAVQWLGGRILTPPFSHEARREAGWFVRLLQQGQTLAMPHSRPMPSIGAHCHELRVRDVGHQWRIIYRIDPHEVLVVTIFSKKTGKTPRMVIEESKVRLAHYDAGH